MIAPVVEAVPPGAVLADVRWYLDGRSGRAAHEAGHLPGAVFVDLDRHLAGPPSPAAGRHPLPSAEAFAASMAELGIGAQDTVVAYDDAGGAIAARLVWMLRVLGVQAALLDGGIVAHEGPLETGPVERAGASFPTREWPPERLADTDAAAAGPLVLDARAGERFRGEVEPVDPRAGHIPGARSLPTLGHVGAAERFLPVDALRQRFADLGVDSPTTELIAYCGSGVTACHTLLALEHAGLGWGRLYAGSWSQYSATDRPAATGDS